MYINIRCKLSSINPPKHLFWCSKVSSSNFCLKSSLWQTSHTSNRWARTDQVLNATYRELHYKDTWSSFTYIHMITIIMCAVKAYMWLQFSTRWTSDRRRHDNIMSLSSRGSLSLGGARQAVSVLGLRPLRVPRGAAGHSGTALSGLEKRPGQLRARLVVWWQRALPGDPSPSGLRRQTAGRPHCRTQQHRGQQHRAVWCVLLQG